MTGEAARFCDRCGRGLRDTEVPLGLCGFCIIDPAVPLPVAMMPPASQIEPAPNPDRPGATYHYRHRPPRLCPGGCGRYLKPRKRYCDWCRKQHRREAVREHVRHHRKKRAVPKVVRT